MNATPLPLCPRQAAVVALCRRGFTLKECAEQLGLSYVQARDSLKLARRRGHIVKPAPSKRQTFNGER